MFKFNWPSCGKTWFARLVKQACIKSGQITNMSRNSSFPFNNCVNKRILHWDEPSYDPSALDDLKMFFSGDEISMNVKYSPHTIIPRTPVIVTANSYVFPREEAYNIIISYDGNGTEGKERKRKRETNFRSGSEADTVDMIASQFMKRRDVNLLVIIDYYFINHAN